MQARKQAAAREANSSISVLVADDHGVLRDGLRLLLDSHRDFRVVAVAHDGGGAVQQAEKHRPRVAILGVALPGLDGIEATRLIAEKVPGVAVLILSMQASPAAVRRALEAGALGYLYRESNGDDLLDAVRSVASGSRYVGKGLAERIANPRHGAQTSESGAERLTMTERNILKLVADGLSNPRVAETLGLSRRTVETYRLRLMRKLGIGSLAMLVKYAIRHGISPLD